MQTLRETKPVARKQHKCNLCGGKIMPGNLYERATNVFDGHIYDWLTCTPCLQYWVLDYVFDWTHFPDEGITQTAAQEWAEETAIHGTGHEQEAAKQYLKRRDHHAS